MSKRIESTGSSAVEQAFAGVEKARERLNEQTSDLFAVLDTLTGHLTDVLMPRDTAEAGAGSPQDSPEEAEKKRAAEREERRAKERYAVPLAERIHHIEYNFDDHRNRLTEATALLRDLVVRLAL